MTLHKIIPTVYNVYNTCINSQTKKAQRQVSPHGSRASCMSSSSQKIAISDDSVIEGNGAIGDDSVHIKVRHQRGMLL